MNKAGILSIQFEPKLNDIEANLLKVQELAENFFLENSVNNREEGNSKNKRVDIINLPEFFTTGVSKAYCDNPFPKNGGKAIEFLSNLAKRLNTNIIAGTLVVKEGDKLFNKMFVLNREGKTVAEYRKIHLFKYLGGTENMLITPGENKPVVVELDFARVGLSICYDIQYPLHYRKLAQMGAEIIIGPSAWGYLENLKGQKETNTALFRAFNLARASENAVYFATINQAGKADGTLMNVGHSMIVSPYGEILAEGGIQDETIYAEIDLKMVRNLKKSMPLPFEE